ncbi:MAG: hypothetical protein QHH09_01400 [Microgenomates group bacterium]|nr:hypothetical protein [Microgenomates group bacterium]
MKNINTPYHLKNKLNEVFFIEPNDLGWVFLTKFYKKITSYLKTAPFIIIIPLSFFFSFLFYLIFGKLLVKIVNLLQYGF